MTDPDRPAALVLADDLIWGTRLRDTLRRLGAHVVLARDAAAWDARLGETDLAVVDLTARAYDGVAAIDRAARAGVRVVAVAQHDDHELRRRALAAGAERVFAYRKLWQDGETTLGPLLGGSAPGPVAR
jgi:CheY-like chemotaxis protein